MRTELLKFHEHYYVAPRMKLAVLGKGAFNHAFYIVWMMLVDEISVLEDWVRKLFAAVPYKEAPRIVWPAPPFRPEDVQVRRYGRKVYNLLSL